MKKLSMFLVMFSFFSSKADQELSIGSLAPKVELKTQTGETFDLQTRKGRWSVLYFYPKDDTPGCTKQACAFRDSIEAIRALNAEIYGVSKDTVESHKKFVEKYKLNFPILADFDGKVIQAFGVKGILGMAKRHTFIIDPELRIAYIMKSVDPVANAGDVAEKLKELQKGKTTP